MNSLGAMIQGFRERETHMMAVLHAKPVEQEEADMGEPETVNQYQCGGSLIAPGVVLTAAHCVDKFRQNPGELKVRAGEWYKKTPDHQDRQVRALEIHPEFVPSNHHNDFAVLFTTEDFVLSNHITTVSLPQADEESDFTTCFATGWRKDKFGAEEEYEEIVSKHACQDELLSRRLGRGFELDDSFLCAGRVKGKDTCKGDGGSPLVCPSKKYPNTCVQAGIVAWGIGRGENNVPGVYADVSKATCWIDQAITCHYRIGNSFFGYTSDVCGAWLNNKINELTEKRDTPGNDARIFQNVINGYKKCNVIWEQPAKPMVEDNDDDNVQDLVL